MEMIQDTIIWDKRYILGVPLIDKQHEHMINDANELNYASLESPNDPNSRFKDIAGNAIGFIHHHFATEEKLMELLGFRGFFHHKREHENFIREVLELSRQHKSGKKVVPHNFVYFLKSWILSHIVVSDKAFATYILDMKLNGQLRQILEGSQDSFSLSA